MRKKQEEVVIPNKQEQEQESSFLKRLFELRDRLKLGPHHKMERFIVLVGSTSVFLLLFSIIGFFHYYNKQSDFRASQAYFNESFRFSLSGQSADVLGVYGDKNKQDVMVLFKFENPSEMSANAKNYELFITGEDGKLKYKPKVTFNLFGSTGYGMIRFQHNEPLRNEVLDVVIRSNSDITLDDNRGSREDYEGDKSFSKYDQARLYVNVGAKNVKTLSSLSLNETDVKKLYTALVGDERDKEIRDEIRQSTDKLKKLLARADEYKDRLESLGFVPPEEPWFVKGDTIDEQGVFKPATYTAKAIQLDYWTKSIHDGYINQVISDISEYDKFMTALSEKEPTDDAPENVVPIDEIQGKDGSVLRLDTVNTDSSTSVQVSAKEAVSSLMDIWGQYLSEKKRVQEDYMKQFVVLDMEVQVQPISFTQYDAVTFW